MDIVEHILSNIDYDGYVYCIDLKNGRCKIGRTGSPGTYDEVWDKLWNRYSNSHEEIDIVHLVNVSNNVDAEKYIFEKLKDLRVTREIFRYEPDVIETAFRCVAAQFPDVNALISYLDHDQLTYLNKRRKNLCL